MSSDFKSRIKTLEARSALGDAGLLATLLGRCSREGSMSAAVKSLETERGRPLDADLMRRAEQTGVKIQALVCAMERTTNGTRVGRGPS